MSGKISKQRRGATMVEFAFVFILFLLLVVGLMELGRGVWTYNTLAHAVRQGARYAMAHGNANPATSDQIRAVVQSNAVGLDSTRLVVNTSWNPANQRGGIVEVQARYTFELVASSLILANSAIPLSSTSRMVIAN